MLGLIEWCEDCAGNWRKFDSFAWHDQPDDAGNWAHAPLDNRDSDALSQSNAKAIIEAIREADPRGLGQCWRIERHSHWGVGWCRVLTFRVMDKRGQPTRAAIAAYECAAALEDYPVLNEQDYYEREHEQLQERWEWLSMRDRMEACTKSGLSFLAARSKNYPSEVHDWLNE